MDFSGKNKEAVVKILKEIGYEQCALGMEKGLNNFKHLHAYIKTKHYWKFENLKLEPLDVYLMNLEKCRSSKVWLKYLTKEDEEPYLENVDYDLLHGNFLMMKYVKENEVMNPLDYAVRRYQTEFKRKRLEQWHTQY